MILFIGTNRLSTGMKSGEFPGIPLSLHPLTPQICVYFEMCGVAISYSSVSVFFLIMADAPALHSNLRKFSEFILSFGSKNLENLFSVDVMPA